MMFFPFERDMQAVPASACSVLVFLYERIVWRYGDCAATKQEDSPRSVLIDCPEWVSVVGIRLSHLRRQHFAVVLERNFADTALRDVGAQLFFYPFGVGLPRLCIVHLPTSFSIKSTATSAVVLRPTGTSHFLRGLSIALRAHVSM